MTSDFLININNMFKKITAVALLLLLTKTLYAYKVVKEIVKVENGIEIPIIIYLPEGDGNFPVMFNVHGGGWNGGTATKVPEAIIDDVQPYLVDAMKVIHVGLAYRCKLQGGTFELALKDIDDSYKWFKKRAKKYNADMKRVGFSGGSAGTPLSAVYAQRLKNCKIYVGINGLFDLVERDPKRSAFPDKKTAAIYGVASLNDRRNASAIYQIRKKPPVTLLVHGTTDHIIDYRQSEAFAQKIREKGGKANTLIFEGISHGLLRIYYPEVFTKTAYEVAKLYQEEFSLPEGFIDLIVRDVDGIVAPYRRHPKIEESNLLGAWSCTKKWGQPHGEIIFEASGKGKIAFNKKPLQPMTYSINGNDINVLFADKSMTFFLMQNSETLYYRHSDGMFEGMNVMYSKGIK